jgi:hypothetical protein
MGEYQADDQMVFGLVNLLACLLGVTKLLDLNMGGGVSLGAGKTF